VQFKDYYEVMGVAREATDAQIKQAYRRLARKFHPDVSKEKNAEARFKELGEAYEVLKDPQKRAAYDRLGKGPRPGEEFRPPPDWNAGFGSGGAGSGADLGGFSDFFESLFGRAAGMHAGRGGTQQGEDHHARVLLDLDASLQGGARALTLEDRTLNVQIPKGILAGQHIRLAGQGLPGPAGDKNGDLYIEVDFQPHRLYRIDGRDLAITLPVAPWEAMLGATIKTPTPGGLVDLKIPAGSHAGSKLRLKGRGIPSSPPGDLYAVLEISLPPATDAKARAAYSAFAAACPFNPRAQLGV
jgi:curved DNA-binding protein